MVKIDSRRALHKKFESFLFKRQSNSPEILKQFQQDGHTDCVIFVPASTKATPDCIGFWTILQYLYSVIYSDAVVETVFPWTSGFKGN